MELELAPKQIWTVAAEAEAKNFYMVEPEIWVPVAQSLGGKRVNLLLEERCLPHVYNTLKNCGPLSGATQTASMESVSLRRLVAVARGPSGAGPDWKQSVQSAQGRPCV